MLDCFTFCKADSALALMNLKWIAEMGGVKDHDMLMVVPEGVPHAEHEAAAESAFRKVTVYEIDDVNSGWPFGANHAFKRAVDYIAHFKLGPFLYHECDAVPTEPEWLNKIAAEFAQAMSSGKRFMGYLEYGSDPERCHMNGVGVYSDVHAFAPSLLSAPTPFSRADVTDNHMAFDWAGKDEVVPLLHVSKLFHFQYKTEDTLLRDESLSWLKPGAVIFHTSKNPRFIELLRARRNGTSNERAAAMPISPAQAVEQTPKASPSRLLQTDIFIKTYPKVAQWHEQAMRSIARFCTGFRRTVVVGEQPVEGYQEMQVVKLSADRYTDADYILFTDSDCIFSRPVTPETYLCDGKPTWLYRSWGSAVKQEGDAVLKWQRGMSKFFGVVPPGEFMCRHPEMVPRWLLIAFRAFCQTRHRMTMEQWVLKDKDFADWNILGMYAWLYHSECFHWINQDAETPPPITVKQYWGGHTTFDDKLPEIEAILAGGVEVQHVGNEGIALQLPSRKSRVKPVAKTRKRGPMRPELRPAMEARMAALRARKAVKA